MLHDFGPSRSPECVRLLLRGSAERFHFLSTLRPPRCATRGVLTDRQSSRSSTVSWSGREPRLHIPPRATYAPTSPSHP